jgi:hypothetical protein
MCVALTIRSAGQQGCRHPFDNSPSTLRRFLKDPGQHCQVVNGCVIARRQVWPPVTGRRRAPLRQNRRNRRNARGPRNSCPRAVSRPPSAKSAKSAKCPGACCHTRSSGRFSSPYGLPFQIGWASTGPLWSERPPLGQCWFSSGRVLSASGGVSRQGSRRYGPSQDSSLRGAPVSNLPDLRGLSESQERRRGTSHLADGLGGPEQPPNAATIAQRARQAYRCMGPGTRFRGPTRPRDQIVRWLLDSVPQAGHPRPAPRLPTSNHQRGGWFVSLPVRPIRIAPPNGIAGGTVTLDSFSQGHLTNNVDSNHDSFNNIFP